MAFQGAAQIDLDGSVAMEIKVKRDNRVIATFNETLDTALIGAQLKYDILEMDEVDQPIPEDMLQKPEDCLMVLVTCKGKILVGNFERLVKFEDHFKGAEVSMEILDPEATIKNETITFEDLGITSHPTNPQES